MTLTTNRLACTGDRALIERAPNPSLWDGSPYSDTISKRVVRLEEENVNGYDCPCYKVESQENFYYRQLADSMIRCPRCGQWSLPGQHDDCSCPDNLPDNTDGELICANCDRPCYAYWQPFLSCSDEEEWRFASDCCNAPVTDAAGNAVDEPPDRDGQAWNLDFFDCDDVGLE